MENINSIKEKVLGKIASIEDEEYLMALLKILESRPVDKIKLSDEEKRFIDKSMEDYYNGRVLTQEEIEKEDEEWLNGN